MIFLLLHYTVCFTDLGKLNLLKRVDYKLEPMFAAAPAASKNEAPFKCGQNLLKMIILLP